MTADESAQERAAKAGESVSRTTSERKGSRPGRGLALRNWRVRRRLVAVILIPVIAAVGLGGLRIASSWESAKGYQRAEQLARVGEEVTTLVHELQMERDLVAGYIAQGRSGNPARIEEQRKRVDAAVDAVRRKTQAIDDSYSAVLQSKLVAAENRLQNLAAIRSSAMKTKLPAVGAIDAYSDVVSALLDLTVEIGQSSGSSQLEEQVRALNALSRAKEQVSQQRALMYVALQTGQFRSDLFESYLVADAAEESALSDFEATASVQKRQLLADTVTGPRVDQAARLEAKALARVDSPGAGTDLALPSDQWFETVGVRIDLMRSVEKHLVQDIVARSQALQADARVDALRDAAVVLLTILLALTIALVVARSMTRPLRELRSSALEVADERLPDVVRQLQQSDGRTADVRVERTSIDSRDEIGQVARAFDEVHEEAVRLAIEQAALRGNVNSMFVNLSRRSQGLVERQLRLIDELENGEQDPDQLASLFKLDHLATRMRRHGENLLVLAGEEPGRRWGQPVPLVDVLRAAVSEVEQYERVELQAPPGLEVGGRAVNDVVHLVAELLENATSYSSKEAKVALTSERLADGRVMMEITDGGIGMGADELAEANERLASQPVVDVSVSRRMGLFVVGRLAWRHGIRVQLRSSEGGGVSALIMLPEEMVTVRTSSLGSPATASHSSGPFAAVSAVPSGGASAAETNSAPPQEPTVTPAAAHEPVADDPHAPEPGPTGDAVPAAPTPAAGDVPPATQEAVATGQASAIPDTHPASPTTEPFAARVTSVHSRPVYGDGPATDPAAAPVQPHPNSGQQSSRQQSSRQQSSRQPSASSPNTSTTGGPAEPTSPQGPGTPPPWYAQPGQASSSTAYGGSDTSGWRRETDLNDSDSIFEGSTSTTSGDRTQRLPIFDEIQSEWFRRRTGSSAHRRSPEDDPLSSPAWSRRSRQAMSQQSSSQSETESWRSPGDEAWRFAEQTISAPASSGTTTSGLPRRVPGRNFVPGSPEEPAAATSASTPTQGPERSAEDIGSRLSSYHQGIRRGRHSGGDDDREREQENV